MVYFCRSLVRLLGLSMLLGSCSPPNDMALIQAMEAARGLGQAAHLQRSCFYWIYPQGQPTDFVSYLFSDLGAAEWPIALDPDATAEMHAVGITPLPEGVRFSADQRQHRDRKELVLTANNGAGHIELVSYLPGVDKPYRQATFTLAAVSPDDLTQQFCQAALESGMSPGIPADSLPTRSPDHAPDHAPDAGAVSPAPTPTASNPNLKGY